MSNIKRSYFNPKCSGSFAGLSTFLKNRKLNKTKLEVENELLKDPAYYFYRPARKLIKHRRRVLVHLPNFQLVVDLIDVQRFAKENANYRYILIAVDGFSRKIYCVTIKDKRGETLITAFKKIFKLIPRTVRYVQSDFGTEFVNQQVQEFFNSKEIIWFSTYSSIKASLAERAISTIMTRLSRVFTHQKNNKYLKVLPLIFQSYNNTIHSSIGVAPNQVTEKNQDQVWDYLYRDLINQTKIKKPRFKVGDKVRLSVVKSTFQKGYMPRYTEEVFEIFIVQQTIPPTYIVRDSAQEEVKGSFYESELLRVP